MASQPELGFGPPATPPTQDTLFTAVKPDAEAIQATTALLARDAGLTKAPQKPELWHVTLVDLDLFDEAVAREAAARLSSLSMPAFELRFDRLFAFPGKHGNTVILQAGKDANPELRRLHAAQLAALAGIPGLPRPKRLQPHMTLIYGARTKPDIVIPPIAWTVRQFSLIHSHYGKGAHTDFGPWPLSA
jgi:2'-5' RNA ligase